jgi:Tfp pilus assembly protein PilO
MKATDRGILFAVLGLVLAAAFYMMILSPKRQEASDLNKDISELEESISQQEQVAAFAEQARKEFPTYYGRLVTLGKAVPEDSDTASMLVQLNSLAGRSDVQFFGLNLAEGATGTGTSSAQPAPTTPAPAAPGAEGAVPAPGAEGAVPAEGSTATPAAAPADASAGTAAAPTTTAPAPATEASAANLPIGAVVGPAGLPTLPYELDFTGGYFGVASFIGGLDGMVTIREKSGQVVANGRLMTVDGFSLKGGGPGASPILDASFLVTSYVTPGDQGLTAGATPGGPAPAPTAPEAVPASSGTVTP